jgi:hypothetical protein
MACARGGAPDGGSGRERGYGIPSSLESEILEMESGKHGGGLPWHLQADLMQADVGERRPSL